MANPPTFVPSRYLFIYGYYKNAKIRFQRCPPWGYFENRINLMENYKLPKLLSHGFSFCFTILFTWLVWHVTLMGKNYKIIIWHLRKKLKSAKFSIFGKKCLENNDNLQTLLLISEFFCIWLTSYVTIARVKKNRFQLIFMPWKNSEGNENQVSLLVGLGNCFKTSFGEIKVMSLRLGK